MARKSTYTILAVVLALALASTLWAAPSRRHRASTHVKKTVHHAVVASAASQEPVGAQASEQARCTATCAEVIPYYEKQYVARQTHEGAPSCWRTCWTQFGNPKYPKAGADTQKLLWQNLNTRHMRANQCAQTCWDKYHPNAAQEGIVVAGYSGYRSLPRAFTLPPRPTVIVEGVPTPEPEAEQAAPEEQANTGTSADQGEIAATPDLSYDTANEVARPAPVVITPPTDGTFGTPYASPLGSGGVGSNYGTPSFGYGGTGYAPGITFRSTTGGVTYENPPGIAGITEGATYPNASTLSAPATITPDFESVSTGGAIEPLGVGNVAAYGGPIYGLIPGLPAY